MIYIPVIVLNADSADPTTLLMCSGCGCLVPKGAQDLHDRVIHEYAQ
jgi:hypothetical protein